MKRLRRSGPWCAALLAVWFAVAPLRGASASSEIIDRVLAVVAGDLIMLSDVVAARDLGLVAVPAGADADAQVLQRLIERSLILSEVERYAPPEPDAEAVDRRLSVVRAHFPSPEAFASILVRAGIDEQHVRETLRQDLRIEAYLDQRFVAGVADDDELGRYYRDHEAVFTRNGELIPFDEARPEIARVLSTERRNALVSDWVAGLRKRAEIIDLSRER